jgi:hypothetical protein
MAEVLPGFTIILILGYAYCVAHPGTFTSVLASKNTATVIGGGAFVLFTSWIIGTFLDSLRDLLEKLLDGRFPIGWRYLLIEPAENVQKLEDSWLAYYFLSGNMAISLVLAVALGFMVECPAFFEPVALIETGNQGANDGTTEEAYA